MSIPVTRNINCLNGKDNDYTGSAATIANTAAPVIDTSNAQVKSIQFASTGVSSGNGAFGIEVSNDGTNWVVYNRLIANAAVADQHSAAMTAAPTLSTNTSSIYFFPLEDYFKFMRVFVTRTTDGTYFATMEMAN